MRIDSFTKLVLTAIALLLAAIAFRPLVNPVPAHAQAQTRDLYIEPGIQMLYSPDGSRSVLGKVVVDLRTGRVWGFPTGGNQVYPRAINSSKPPSSAPLLLGHFELDALDR